MERNNRENRYRERSKKIQERDKEIKRENNEKKIVLRNKDGKLV